jgi:hypothetical protein
LPVAAGREEVGGNVRIVSLGAGADRYRDGVVHTRLNAHVGDVEGDPARHATIVPGVWSPHDALVVIAPDPGGVVAQLAGEGIDAEVGDRTGY